MVEPAVLVGESVLTVDIVGDPVVVFGFALIFLFATLYNNGRHSFHLTP